MYYQCEGVYFHLFRQTIVFAEVPRHTVGWSKRVISPYIVEFCLTLCRSYLKALLYGQKDCIFSAGI
jgi:hypothetical protein